MTCTKRSLAELTAPVLAVVVLAIGLAPACARAADSADEIIDRIHQSILDVDKAKAPADRVKAYDRARDELTALKQAAESGDEAARTGIDGLKTDGITPDVVTSGSLSAILSSLTDKGVDPDERIATRVKIDELIEELSAPALKVSALAYYARQIASDHDAALALLERAIGETAKLTSAQEKNAALNDIAQVGAYVEPMLTSKIINRAVSSMWPTRMRGFARYDVALRILGDRKVGKTDVRDAKFDDLSAAIETELSAGRIEQALLLALAVDPESSKHRAQAMNEVLDAALKANAVNLFPVLSTSLADRSDQEDLIVRIVKNRVDANRLIDATAMTEAMETGPGLAEIDFILATELDDRGLTKMALEQYQRGTTIAKALSGEAKEAALIAAISGATDLKRFDDASAFAGQLTDMAGASSALGNLAKAFADSDDLTKAEALLPKIAEQKDREQALSGIGRAKARAGDLNAAASIANEIANDEDKGRVQSEIVRVFARSGRIDDALGLATSIKEPEYRVEALLRLAKEMSGKSGADRARDVVGQAISFTGGIGKAQQRDDLYLDIIDYLSKSNQIDLAKSLVGKISDEKLKAKAAGRIASRAALSGDAKSAFAYLDSQLSAGEEAIRAEVLVAAASDPAYVKTAVLSTRDIRDPMLRVKTFRAIAEVQLSHLDRLGFGMGRGEPADYVMPVSGAQDKDQTTAGVSKSIFSDGRMSIHTTSMSTPPLAQGYPDISKTAATTRAMIPLPVAGRVSITLGNLSPYESKFMEDLAGGSTGLSHAARAQGLLYPRIIVVQSGIYTLGSLAMQLGSVGDTPLIERDGDVVTLRAPLLVGEEASLILSGQEASVYRLSATGGAFMAIAGKLYIQDTTVTSWDETLNEPRSSSKATRGSFRPFIVGWSNSEMYIGGSVMDSLGYAASKSFGLTFSAGPKAIAKARDALKNPTGIVVENYFHNFEYGFYSYEADDISLVGNEYANNVLYAVDPHDRSQRLLIALNTAHDTIVKHGIIISRGVDASWKVGNVVFHNKGSGLMLDRDSVDNLLYGNFSFENDQDGLTFFESSCNLAVANAFIDNGRSGIRLRNSWDVAVRDNTIVRNKLEAISGYISDLSSAQDEHRRDLVMDPYVPLTTFTATGNLISANGKGIKADGASGVTLAQNEFQSQEGRLLDGDARPFEGHVLRFNGHEPVAIASTCRPLRPVNYECAFRKAGLVGENDALFFDSKAEGNCTDTHGSVQFDGFHAKGDST
ncbi:right-handed parallel beta-helix repeat-containing protein [Rhizobium sp. BK399]|uniref:right-handed parallel beta-helix repeat-containing protein n=1 Tax=Rhizobium sp. BK399 TaxID=2587063 RepID=UPI00160B3056|nr:right-handed parallel beta-helix repeat-containing protein [Rhizobium sp. BK399]MBB3544202.1 poly(beta-D-mannuronate) C5 epimerase [Rhizobium sp. BK399]